MRSAVARLGDRWLRSSARESVGSVWREEWCTRRSLEAKSSVLTGISSALTANHRLSRPHASRAQCASRASKRPPAYGATVVSVEEYEVAVWEV
jgi:hypothetical protein